MILILSTWVLKLHTLARFIGDFHKAVKAIYAAFILIERYFDEFLEKLKKHIF